MTDLVLRSQRVVTPEGVRAAAVHVADGRIAAVTDPAEVPEGAALVEAGESVVMPGLVDGHVHINEPGRTLWEGFATATRAAAAGGVTTLVDMPLNSIPATTTPEALEEKRAAAEGKCRVDVGFWGGVVPGNQDQLAALRQAGVLGFKCFLVDSGVEEFPPVAEDDLRRALPILADLGAPLLVHAESPGVIATAAQALGDADPGSYATYLASRPSAAEVEAVELAIRLAREHRARIHIVHLSAAEALPSLEAARAEGLPLTVETCPHYLCFAAEDIPDGATLFKCAPPIRDRANNQRLWQALAEGAIDLVASDHSPCPRSLRRLKEGNFLTAWGGIASLQLGLAALWTVARPRDFGLEDLARWLSREPARLAGLEGRKGAIAPGCDADLVIWNPEASFQVEPDLLEHRHPITPYAGFKLSGVVEATFLRGEKVYDRGAFPGPPRGRLLAP